MKKITALICSMLILSACTSPKMTLKPAEVGGNQEVLSLMNIGNGGVVELSEDLREYEFTVRVHQFINGEALEPIIVAVKNETLQSFDSQGKAISHSYKYIGFNSTTDFGSFVHLKLSLNQEGGASSISTPIAIEGYLGAGYSSFDHTLEKVQLNREIILHSIGLSHELSTNPGVKIFNTNYLDEARSYNDLDIFMTIEFTKAQ